MSDEELEEEDSQWEPDPSEDDDWGGMGFNWKSPKTWVTVKGRCIKQRDGTMIVLLLQPLDNIGDLLVEADRSSAARLRLKIGSDVAMQMFFDHPYEEGMLFMMNAEVPFNKTKVVLTNRKCNLEAKLLWWDGHEPKGDEKNITVITE